MVEHVRGDMTESVSDLNHKFQKRFLECEVDIQHHDERITKIDKLYHNINTSHQDQLIISSQQALEIDRFRKKVDKFREE